MLMWDIKGFKVKEYGDYKFKYAQTWKAWQYIFT